MVRIISERLKRRAGSSGGGSSGGGGRGGGSSSSGSSGGRGGSSGSSGGTTGSNSGGTRGGSSGGSSSGSSSSGTRGGPGTSSGTLGGSGNTGRPLVSTNSWSSSASTVRGADYFSRGGGSPFTLGSSSIFAGRQAGGGSRDQVYGTSRFGSGYPYSNGGFQQRGVFGQPFPFGFWPIFYVNHGYSNEYRGGTVNGTTENRPGGPLVQVSVIPNATQWTLSADQTANDTAKERFYLIGDQDSVETMIGILSPCYGCEEFSCGIINSTVTPWDSTNSTVGFENTIQWYRASSFQLSTLQYNNSYATLPLNESTSIDWGNSTPLPQGLADDAFLQCLNNTIGAALPMINGASGRFMGFNLSWVLIGVLWALIWTTLLGEPLI